MIVAGDLNQYIGSNKVQSFFNKLELIDVYSKVNEIELN